MWMIIELISKNSEISLSSRNNPEMSQCSVDVPMLVIFSIYIPHIFSELAGIIQIIKSPLSTMLLPISETFNKSQLSEFFDLSAGCYVSIGLNFYL